MQVYVEHLHLHRDYLTIEMGKAGKWLKQILTGKKEKERVSYSKYIPVETKSGPIVMGPPIPEKKRWSFRRSVTGAKPEMEKKSAHVRRCSDSEMYQKRQLTVVRAADANAAVIRRTSRAAEAVLEVAAIKIQSIFRSYLARKALSALRGLVKLQALIRGQLVRRQTAATLRSMQAMAAAQARARLQMIQMYEEAQDMSHFNQKIHRRSLYEMEEKIKIVEMDLGVSKRSSNSRSSYSYSVNTTPYRRELIQEFSPARSSITEKSPRAYKDDFVGQLSNLYMNSNSGYPNYMAKTESSKAKARSVSAPKQRDDASERTRRSSIDGRSVPRGVANMQRSTSPSSYVSVQESECRSTSGVLMNTKYCRPLKAYEICSELS